jgi:DNA recombination protein RmuC
MTDSWTMSPVEFTLSLVVVLALGVLAGLAFGARRRVSGLAGDDLSAFDERVHHSVRSHAIVLQQELRHVGDLVDAMRQERAEQDGRLTSSLHHTLQATAKLADTTQSLHRALASPKARGQWGERMAEDILRAAGFVEGINYARQQSLPGGTVPDFTFHLPKGHVIHMDVKFPIDNYLRWLDAPDAERDLHVAAFRRDVRNRVAELADRGYIDPDRTIDEVLLFIPNESVYGFLHEHDPELVDIALRHKVILCSPTSLFAVLAVIRQAVDNFLVERQSDEILAAVAGVRDEWQRFGDATLKLGRGLVAAQRALDDLVGPRTRQFEKKLDGLEAVRDERSGSHGRPVAASPHPRWSERPAG